VHPYEEELNEDLATHQRGSDDYWMMARTQHRQECEAREGLAQLFAEHRAAVDAGEDSAVMEMLRRLPPTTEPTL
jgi:hypothetical protein